MYYDIDSFSLSLRRHTLVLQKTVKLVPFFKVYDIGFLTFA